MILTRRLLVALGALALVVAAGVIGYMVIEHWSFLDAVFMTVTTISTVGYQEVHPLSKTGQIFTTLLIIGGVGLSLYILTNVGAYLIGGELRSAIGRRRMKARIAALREHFILCGLGRVGMEIAQTLRAENVPLIVVDNRPECVARAEMAGFLCLQGDATSDETLKNAGIERARGLIAAVGSDTDNTYITLSARGLCPDLFIEARANNEEAETKLRRAGANQVIAPYIHGARRMAMLALHPAVIDFIDTLIDPRIPSIHVEHVLLSSQSPLAGQTVEQVRSCSEASIVALTRPDGKFVANPSNSEKLASGDNLIIIGTREQLDLLEGICGGMIKK